MKLLLDTHIWIWSLLEPERFGRRVTRELAASDAELWLSPISVRELLVLVDKKRLLLNTGPERWLEQALAAAPMREAPLTTEVAVESGRVLLPHKDLADRFLAATAAVYDLTLVTADEHLLRGRGFRHLANR